MSTRIGSRLWAGLPVLAVLLWACGLLIVREYPGLPTPPELTIAGQPLVRYARDIAAMITLGALVVGGLLLHGDAARVARWVLAWATAWLAASLALLVFTVSDVVAVSTWSALDPSVWWPFLADTVIGRVLLAQLMVIPVVIVLALIATRRPSLALAWTTVVLAAGACGAPALLGHGGVTSEHVGMVVSLAVHLIAVSLWVGGLAVTVALLGVEPQRCTVLLPRLSLLALWCVIVLAESGLLNASLRLSSASLFVGTLYGSLVLAKAVLLGWLILLGWQQRTRVVPIATDTHASPRLLTRIAAWELLLMGSAIAVGVVLARIGIESASNPDGRFNPIALLALAVGLPLLLQRVLPRRTSGRVLDFLRSFPEVATIVLLVVIVEVAGVGLVESVLRLELGVVVGALVIIAAGWLWAAAIDGPRLVNGAMLMAVGFPIAGVAVAVISGTTGEWRLVLVCTIVVEMILAVLVIGDRRSPEAATVETEAVHA